MKVLVPYSKEIVFGSKIAEICSISLEHELNINESDIEGNFIISGEYKSHTISVNKEDFNHKLPFSVDIVGNIKKETIDFSITDFTYEIINEDTLKVNIEFLVTAEEIEEEMPTTIEQDILEIEDLFREEEKEETLKEEQIEERIDQKSAELILNTASEKIEEFATYNIHIVTESDSIDSICQKYKTDLNILKDYNNIDNLNIGDKIIIPGLDE